MTEEERNLDMLVSELETENRMLRARNERLEREALAAPVQEPVLAGRWHHGNGTLCSGSLRIARADFDTNPPIEMQDRVFDDICEAMNARLLACHATPTTPPAAQRQWVGLTDEEIKIELDETGLESHEYGQETIQLIRTIEAKLKEKNT